MLAERLSGCLPLTTSITPLAQRDIHYQNSRTGHPHLETLLHVTHRTLLHKIPVHGISVHGTLATKPRPSHDGHYLGFRSKLLGFRNAIASHGIYRHLINLQIDNLQFQIQ